MKLKFCIGVFIFIFYINQIQAQFNHITGQVKDFQSEEPIQYVSIFWKKSNIGVVTDSNGLFRISINKLDNTDTLIISGVGYKNLLIPASKINNPELGIILLKILPPISEVAIKTKYNRAVWFWKKIIKQKDKHNRQKFNNFSYEIYNKLEMDIINFNKEKIKKNFISKPLSFVLNFEDTISEKKPFIPVYLTETISDYYYQKEPNKSNEIIKYTRTNGIENESIIKELGGTYQNINIYNDYITMLNSKQFISPFHKNADQYYIFKLGDTVYEYGRRLIRFRFFSKSFGTPTFEGEAFIHDTSFAVQRITLRPSSSANLNFIEGLSIIQEFKLVNDTNWFLFKDKFIADVTPIGEGNLGIKFRKTSTYQKVLINNASISTKLANNAQDVQIIVLPNSNQNSDSFWQKNRHVPLEKSELSVYLLLDTLKKNPVFKLYKNGIETIARGTFESNKFTLGPWFNWISNNNYEGLRLRFDVATNRKFDEHFNYSGYLAFGFDDNKFKGGLNFRYQFTRKPWNYFLLSYKKDIDNNRLTTGGFGVDNIFGTILRRSNINFKFLQIEQIKATYFNENLNGLSYNFQIANTNYISLLNLPIAPKNNTIINPFKSFETTIGFRYSKQERYIENNFNRFPIRGVSPIIEFTYTKGWANIFGGNNDYQKMVATINDFVPVAPYGRFFYRLTGTLIKGNVTYPYLSIAQGNEVLYYNRNAFNLINQFEYFSDRNLTFYVEHSIDNSILKFFKITRKYKIRQFWNIRGIIGDLSKENTKLNFNPTNYLDANNKLISSDLYGFKSFNGNWYIEAGTGFENIFKYFRVDFVWRLNDPAAEHIFYKKRNFGVYFSFKVNF